MSHKTNLKFTDYLRDFASFLHNPDFKRGPGYISHSVQQPPNSLVQRSGVHSSSRLQSSAVPAFSWLKDWRFRMTWKPFVYIVLLILAVNMFLLTPIVIAAYSISGVVSRIEFSPSLFLYAIAWAPLVEELLFRYFLRRPSLVWWWLPMMVVVILASASSIGIIVLVLMLAVAAWWAPGVFKIRLTARSYKWCRAYRRHFFWVLHISVLIFAMMHLFNYSKIENAPFWALPLLILPQWFVGLFLAWARMRYGILQSVCLHMAYNSVPLIIATLLYFSGINPNGL